MNLLILLLLLLNLHCTLSLITCHLVRSPEEPDSPLPHTSCNHLHQCKASAKHYHTAASREVWLRLCSTTFFHQTKQWRMRLKSFRKVLYSHCSCLHKTNSIGSPFSFDLRMPSWRPVVREISLCLQSSISAWCFARQKRMLPWWLNSGQGRLQCDLLSIQVSQDDKPEPLLQQQSLRCYIPGETVVGYTAWPHLAIHWCHWQSKRTDSCLSQQSPGVFWISPPAAQIAADAVCNMRLTQTWYIFHVPCTWDMQSAHGPLCGGRGSLLLQPWEAAGVYQVPLHPHVSTQQSKAPLTSWVSRHKDGILTWASLAGLWMRERPCPRAPEGEDGWGDVEGDHAVWPVSPWKQRVWEQNKVRDTAKERGDDICAEKLFCFFAISQAVCLLNVAFAAKGLVILH